MSLAAPFPWFGGSRSSADPTHVFSVGRSFPVRIARSYRYRVVAGFALALPAITVPFIKIEISNREVVFTSSAPLSGTGTTPKPISSVLLVRIPAQISELIVGRAGIWKMAGFTSRRTRPNKSAQYERMNFPRDNPSVNVKGHLHVATRIRSCSHQVRRRQTPRPPVVSSLALRAPDRSIVPGKVTWKSGDGPNVCFIHPSILRIPTSEGQCLNR